MSRLEEIRAARAAKERKEAARRRRAELLGEDDAPAAEPETEKPPMLEKDQHRVMLGVTLTWLHWVFKRDRHTAKALLADCPPIKYAPNGAPLYDVAVAAQYLVKPKMDIKKLVGTLKEADLPDDLRDKIWAARLKRQRWEEKAGDLWRTQDVHAVFSETFKRMKESIQLWVDDLAEEEKLTDTQREFFTEKIDKLQKMMHKSLIAQAESSETLSILELPHDSVVEPVSKKAPKVED